MKISKYDGTLIGLFKKIFRIYIIVTDEFVFPLFRVLVSSTLENA